MHREIFHSPSRTTDRTARTSRICGVRPHAVCLRRVSGRHARAVSHLFAVWLLALPLTLAPSPVIADGGSATNALHDRLSGIDKASYPKSDAVVAEQDVVVQVGADGLATTTDTRVVKLLTEKGVRDHAVARFDFDPNTNRFQIKAIRIHRKSDEGVTVIPVDLSRTVTAPAPARSIYWGSMFQAVDIPSLQVNDAIEIVTEKTGFNLAYLQESAAGPVVGAEVLEPPMPGHWHDTVYFQERMPVVEKSYTVRTPRNKPLQYEVCHCNLETSVRFDGDETEYRFVGRDMTVPPREPRMLAFSDVACKLVLTTVEDWIAKSKWFHDANIDQFEPTPEIRAQVDELVEGIEQPEEKMRVINSWVADQIRYVGTARGPCEGYTMHRADETFRDRGGVCKDKAGLAVAMLRIAGFDAFPVMTQAGSDVEATPADQFNHAVAAVRSEDGEIILLDPTWSPTSRELWSSRECLQYVVYGFPGGHELGQSPYFPPAHNSIESEAVSRLLASGELGMDVSFSLRNYPCTSFRRFLARHERRDWLGRIESAFSRLGGHVHLRSASFTEPRDYTRDGSLRAAVESHHYMISSDDTCYFKLPMLQHPLASIWCEDIIREVAENDDRETGMKLRTTRRIKYSDTLTLPASWKIEHLPEAVEIENESGILQFKIRQVEDAIEYSLLVEARQHIVPPENYDDFRKINAGLRDLADAWVSCKTTMPTETPDSHDTTPREDATR